MAVIRMLFAQAYTKQILQCPCKDRIHRRTSICEEIAACLSVSLPLRKRHKDKHLLGNV